MSQQANRDKYLRTSLAQALRKERYGRLCRDEPSDTTHIATILSHGLTWSMVVSLAFWLVIRADLSVWETGGAILGFLLLLVLFASVTKRFGSAVLVIVALWIAAGVDSYMAAGIGGFAATNLLPFGLLALGAWTWRALTLASSIPFLLPVALVIVFLPLLTQDLWVVGDEIGVQLIAVAAVALGPLLVFLAVRYSRISVEEHFVEALTRIAKTDELEGQLLAAVKGAPREHSVDPPPDDWLWGKLKGQYRQDDSKLVARDLGREFKATFRRQTILRLGRVTIGIGALFGAFVYVLAWAAIPVSTSARWIGHDVSMSTVELIGWTVAFPTAQYLSVAVLLSIVAAAAFIAFALTEDRYSIALSEVLVQKPAERCVMLGVPYRALYAAGKVTQ